MKEYRPRKQAVIRKPNRQLSDFDTFEGTPTPFVVAIPPSHRAFVKDSEGRMIVWARQNGHIIGVPESSIMNFLLFATEEAALEFRQKFLRE